MKMKIRIGSPNPIFHHKGKIIAFEAVEGFMYTNKGVPFRGAIFPSADGNLIIHCVDVHVDGTLAVYCQRDNGVAISLHGPDNIVFRYEDIKHLL